MNEEKDSASASYDTNSGKARSLREINTYDSPIDPLSFAPRGEGRDQRPKGILGGIYKFAATAIVILTVIFSASELIDFIVSDMDASGSLLKRIFGSAASSGSGDVFGMILDQTFGNPSHSPDDDVYLPIESPAECTPESTPESSPHSSSQTQPESPSPIESSPAVTESTQTAPIPIGAHPIISMDLGLLSYGDGYINNSTALSPSISSLATLPLKRLERTDGPLVLVIHTHGTESFMPEGATYYTDDGELARSQNTDENMIAVGVEFVSTLESHGIEAIHCTVMHDKESYRESYSRSAEAIKYYLEMYPSIRYIFDLHRDSVMKSTEELVSAVTYINGERVAQIMPVIGSGFSGYEDNLAFALKLRSRINGELGSFSRPVCLRESQYNQSLAPVSLLLEIGTSGNTLSEAKRAARLTAEAVAEMINDQCPPQ